MKKTIKTLIIIVLFVISIIFQIFIFNNITLFGIKPNMLLIFIIIIATSTNIYICSISSFITGVIADLIFGTFGIYTISYSIIGALVGFISDNYIKENPFSAAILTTVSTILFELINYIKTIIISSKYIGITYFLSDVIISTLLNVVIISILTFMLSKINSLIDKKQNKIYW